MTPLEILTAILNSLWQAAALAVLVWLVLKWLRVNAATRCVIWWAMLIVLIVLPVAPRFTMLERPSQSAANRSNRSAATPAGWYPMPAEVELPPAIVTLPEKPVAKWPLIVVAVWVGVFLFRLGRVVQSYLYLRGVKRKSMPSDFPLPDVGRRARVLISSDIASPMAVGFLHPAIILPEDLADGMTRAELDQIVLHEAAHLARRDDWWNLIARLLGAALALHPVAWWILRQIEYEREAACDDWVVARTGAARLYAETLAHIVELTWANGDSRRSEALASGVFGHGSRIGERIETLLEAGRQFSPRVSIMRVAAGVFLLLLLAGAGSLAPRWIAFAKTPASQPETETRMAFEVASIKPNPSEENRTPHSNKENPGGIDYKYISISDLIRKAFSIKTNFQLILPRGYQQKPWEIAAKAPANSRMQDFPLMLRSLLADRFHLAFHHETREMQVYELVVAKGGSKLKEVDPPGGGIGGNRTADGMLHVKDNTTLATLATFLTEELRMPVIDKTSLQGIFDIDFEYQQMETAAPSGGGAPVLPGPTIFDALEKTLGLKLVQKKDPVEVLVVDHLDTNPTEN